MTECVAHQTESRLLNISPSACSASDEFKLYVCVLGATIIHATLHLAIIRVYLSNSMCLQFTEMESKDVGVKSLLQCACAHPRSLCATNCNCAAVKLLQRRLPACRRVAAINLHLQIGAVLKSNLSHQLGAVFIKGSCEAQDLFERVLKIISSAADVGLFILISQWISLLLRLYSTEFFKSLFLLSY